ncbi:diaminobutyrate--2-oxoglutarate transaminase [Pantoea sp. S61]|uniref:diaminobutyrate--2-oxoglutarate transaminase n=1 Tax=Pantoea sp. S61 TaxID=2767442 RepID=UPI00190C024A|nr:diaminobutyrate--2-oxoglutarate transaminase [Pantoea sp. S61]MBK0126157.1 diaminobutyrate--2-oxoglutarate transaminase [Pantoea sp. S61]
MSELKTLSTSYTTKYESNVRSYPHDFPEIFSYAKGSIIYSENGNEYIDFFSGAGALNYGHNDDLIKKDLLRYISSDGIAHSLDMMTSAKENFIKTLQSNILLPRQLGYKVQFTGPTGANAVEAALKLSRKITQRNNIAFYSNAFHGMSLGALSVTSNPQKRAGAGIPLSNSVALPYEGSLGGNGAEIKYLKHILKKGSGIEKPAAIIMETIQGEGGVDSASSAWLEDVYDIARENNILFIVDDIQAGCGRSGDFFSFDHQIIKPDIVILSKSISGYGLPLALILIKDEHDIWSPGEHNGTFRGNNHAFITAQSAIENYWKEHIFIEEVKRKSKIIENALSTISSKKNNATIKGRGFLRGIEFADRLEASKVQKKLFKEKIIIETSGVDAHVLKILPALNIPDNLLNEALDKIVQISTH